jgi:beta-phosphoglucomutase-like phosphatase (HAD superfamily)
MTPANPQSPTILDILRVKVDPDDFDAVVFWLETVATDLGYGDIRPQPGAIQWIDRLRDAGKRTVLAFSGTGLESAARLAGLDDRFDLIVTGPRKAATYAGVLGELDVTPDRGVAVDTNPDGITSALDASLKLAIGVARDGHTAETLRRAGANAVVADLHEFTTASA